MSRTVTRESAATASGSQLDEQGYSTEVIHEKNELETVYVRDPRLGWQAREVAPQNIPVMMEAGNTVRRLPPGIEVSKFYAMKCEVCGKPVYDDVPANFTPDPVVGNERPELGDYMMDSVVEFDNEARTERLLARLLIHVAGVEGTQDHGCHAGRPDYALRIKGALMKRKKDVLDVS